MKECYSSFLHFLPTEKENMAYEEFRNIIGRAIRMHNYLDPTMEMERFFQDLYSFDAKTYKVVRNQFKISYSILKSLAKTLNKVISKENEEPLEYLNFTVEVFKRKRSIVRGEMDKILKVDRNSDAYKKFANNDFDDETLASIIGAVKASRRKFKELFGFLAEDNGIFNTMYGSFYEEELDSISSEVLDEIRYRVGKILSSINSGREGMITQVIGDDILIGNRKYNRKIHFAMGTR